jgi:hypothetical protein
MRAPAPPYAGEGAHALWHVSDAAGIRRFEPRRTPTASSDDEVVWAIDTRHLPLYWFPRDCPRATFWADDRTSEADAEHFLLGTASRVHAVEAPWLERLRTARPVAYRLPDAPFEPHPETGGYWVAREAVEPLDLTVLDDLLGRHAAAGIELRIVPALAPLWRRVVASTLQFSGIRLRNADPPIGESEER